MAFFTHCIGKPLKKLFSRYTAQPQISSSSSLEQTKILSSSQQLKWVFPMMGVVFSILFFSSCSCSTNKNSPPPFQIGIDPNWYPLNFDLQTSYVNGFTEELLLEIATLSHLTFERIVTNWDSLNEGLKQGEYHAILSSMPPYDFNLAAYDFSQNFLDIGPVLIVSTQDSYSDLKEMKGKRIGILSNDPVTVILQTYPELTLQNYNSIAELLDALVKGNIEGAIADRIQATAYVNDLFGNKLKVIESPLNSAGLRLITVKGKNEDLQKQFNQSLDKLKKQKKLQALRQKWRLGT